MKRTDLNFMQRIGLEVLWGCAYVFSVMPRWFKYHVVENLLYVVLYRCVRYRMSVVKTNLRNSFPEKSEEELAAQGQQRSDHPVDGGDVPVGREQDLHRCYPPCRR